MKESSEFSHSTPSMELERRQQGAMDYFKGVPDFSDVELRQEGKGLRGSFKYGQTAVIANRGRRRKERIDGKAFDWAWTENAGGTRRVDALVGHDFDKPLATAYIRTNEALSTLKVTRSAASLDFVIDELPDTSYVADLRAQLAAGLVLGVSPGFIVPPRDVVPDAELEIPEPGNPDVTIRVIKDALLLELSIVTRPAYPGTEVDVRDGLERPAPARLRKYWL